MQTEKQLLKYHLRSRSFIALKTAFLVFSFKATICCRESILFWSVSNGRSLLPDELLDAVEFVEPEVWDVVFDFVAVQVSGVDLLYSSAANQRDTLVTRALGHKHHGVVLCFDLCAPAEINDNRQTQSWICLDVHIDIQMISSPERECVLLCVKDVSVFPVLSFLLLVVHLRILCVLWAHWISVVSAAH